MTSPPARPDPASGVFETLRVSRGRPELLAGHLARLTHSVTALYGRPLPPLTAEEIASAAATLPEAGRVRIDVVPDRGRLSVTITAHATDGGPPAPVALAALHVPGGLGAHKWRDRGLIEAAGADPVPLLLDSGEVVLEAAWGNIWILDGDRLRTPPLDGRILPGVTRARLAELAPALGLSVTETALTLADIRRAPTVLITSAVRLAVTAALDRTPQDDPAVARIRQALASA